MEDKEDRQCYICGSDQFPFVGISSCNHFNCAKCAIKLRIFAQSQTTDSKSCDYRNCITCRQTIKEIVIARTISRFEDFDLKKLGCEKSLELYFVTNDCRQFFDRLLRINCFKCRRVFKSKEELVEHMPDHDMAICHFCAEYEMCLPSELRAHYSRRLQSHFNKCHARCNFCLTNHYNQEHLLKHVKTAHFLCDICHPEAGFVAYNTQEEWLKHMGDDHHLCRVCKKENKINVFRSDYELRLHRGLHHGNLVTEGVITVRFNDPRTRREEWREEYQQEQSEVTVEESTVPQRLKDKKQETKVSEMPKLDSTATNAIGDSDRVEEITPPSISSLMSLAQSFYRQRSTNVSNVENQTVSTGNEPIEAKNDEIPKSTQIPKTAPKIKQKKFNLIIKF